MEVWSGRITDCLECGKTITQPGLDIRFGSVELLQLRICIPCTKLLIGALEMESRNAQS
jgi:hypothetical protein